MENIKRSCTVERIENMRIIRLLQISIGDLLNEFFIYGGRGEKECTCKSEYMQGLRYKVKSQEATQKNRKRVNGKIRKEHKKREKEI